MKYVVFYYKDAKGAKEKVAELREGKNTAMLRTAYGVPIVFEPCEHIAIMPDVPEAMRLKINQVYGMESERQGIDGGAADETPTTDPGKKAYQLKQMNKASLLEYAAYLGLTLDDGMTNPQMVEAIQAREVEVEAEK